MFAHTSEPCTWKMELERSGVEDHLQLSYMSPVFTTKVLIGVREMAQWLSTLNCSSDLFPAPTCWLFITLVPRDLSPSSGI